MNSENFNTESAIAVKNLRKLRILVAPLDWGLGHATRCVPIISELLAAGAEVWLAGEGAQQALLSTEFPDLPFLSLPGYRVRYGASGWSTLSRLLWQSPRITRAIRAETTWLRNAVANHRFDAVISDNRYGLHHPDIPCIFITHQLRIASPFGGWTETWLQNSNYRYINRFTECWVPDEPGEFSAAGRLSHPSQLPAIPVHYLGLLSRFAPAGADQTPVQKNRLLILLSGPEPQRSLLEAKLLPQLRGYPGPAVMVRGLPGSTEKQPEGGAGLQIYPHLAGPALREQICRAEWIIARSGYSTVMELLCLRKKSILLPTPGQTEQGYLAHHLAASGLACTSRQDSFNLDRSLQAAAAFAYRLMPVTEQGRLRERVRRFLSSLVKD